MTILSPSTREELVEALRAAASAEKSITLGGAFSKRAMAGPAAPADVCISTRALNRVLEYEPRDLTVSVEAGLPIAELKRILAEQGQMLPLDPPFAESATVGGVVATNGSGPRRRAYGTARDMVIGMTFAALDGRLLNSGGMVVKNVAGLDVLKTLIGSFGTLAAISSVNFRTYPQPEATRSYVLSFECAAKAVELRDAVLRGVLQPAALDVVNAAAAEQLGLKGYCVLVRAGGSESLLQRYGRELAGAEVFDGAREADLWRGVEEFAANQRFVARAGHPMPALKEVLDAAGSAPCVARAGNGVSYVGFGGAGEVRAWMKATAPKGWSRVVEFAPEEAKKDVELWPGAGGDLVLMEKMKDLFDPKHLLNRGRLYGRL